MKHSAGPDSVADALSTGSSGWGLTSQALVGASITFACFFTMLLSVLVPNYTMFIRRHARRHRVLGLLYLLWLLYGFFDLFTGFGTNEFIYHVVLGILGVAVTLTAAFDFRYHERVKNRASGTLEKTTTVTFSEMIEHSFYQGLNLLQISYLHILDTDGGRPFWQGITLLLLVTAPWLVRGYFPVNSFSKNYTDIPLRDYSLEVLMYRVKKWQYVFYKHALLHGVNVSAALSTPEDRTFVRAPLFRLYWLSLNCSYVMEFFLQTLVKKNIMSQSMLLSLQKLLMAVASVSALFVLMYVRWDVCAISFALNMVNRGHDFVNTCLVVVAALSLSHLWAVITA
mmetsp:Transcript_839/g.1917  ORF Transcript_839/g.1917 Transcript_839/m.1917 type:complete len:340 (+) Transcript_839:152-1171(+)